MNIISHIIIRNVWLLVVLGLFGCGGGQPSNTNTGVFVDSAVEGLNYKTDSVSGVTGPNGEFQYKTGEVVTFSLGDVVIGSTVAGAVITPLHFGAAFRDTDITALNIARLLQSLDVDGNPDNGIQITPEIHDAMKGRSIRFNRTDFEDADMSNLFDTLNARRVFTFNGTCKLKSLADAQRHLRQTLLRYQIITSPTFSVRTSIRPTFQIYSTRHISPPTILPRYTSARIIRPPVFGKYTTLHVTFPRITSSRRLLTVSGVPPKKAYPVILTSTF